MTPKLPANILVIRNDKLGDFTLSLPTFAFLKNCLPAARLHALVPAYTRPIAEACPYIDEVIIDPGTAASRHAHTELVKRLKLEKYDAVLTLYSTTRIGFLLARLRIPVRVAPATKLAQLFYNHRLRQRRSQSSKPEYEYNLDLARQMITIFDDVCDYIPQPPYLYFDKDEIARLREDFCHKHAINPNKKLLFIHPGSGGSANNLSPDQYTVLAEELAQHDRFHIIISAGPGEYDVAHSIASRLPRTNHHVYESRDGLSQFAKHIAFADIFISGSTGPLHVAGALNRPTVGFYTNRQSATSLRWQTLSTDERRLAFSPPADAEPEDMAKVDLHNALIDIQTLLARLYPFSAGANP